MAWRELQGSAEQRTRGRPLWGRGLPPTCTSGSSHHGDQGPDWAAVLERRSTPVDEASIIGGTAGRWAAGVDHRLLLPPNQNADSPSFHVRTCLGAVAMGLGGRVHCPIRQNWPWLPAAVAQWVACTLHMRGVWLRRPGAKRAATHGQFPPRLVRVVGGLCHSGRREHASGRFV